MKSVFYRFMAWLAKQHGLQLAVPQFFRFGGWLLMLPARLIGFNAILLTTVGRKSGKQYTIPIAAIRQADAYVIMAGLTGAGKYPNWYLNLKQNPQAEVESYWRKEKVRAEEIVEPAERVALLKQYPMGLMDTLDESVARQVSMMRLRR